MVRYLRSVAVLVEREEPLSQVTSAVVFTNLVVKLQNLATTLDLVNIKGHCPGSRDGKPRGMAVGGIGKLFVLSACPL